MRCVADIYYRLRLMLLPSVTVGCLWKGRENPRDSKRKNLPPQHKATNCFKFLRLQFPVQQVALAYHSRPLVFSNTYSVPPGSYQRFFLLFSPRAPFFGCSSRSIRCGFLECYCRRLAIHAIFATCCVVFAAAKQTTTMIEKAKKRSKHDTY
jgi:hypothetical protein